MWFSWTFVGVLLNALWVQTQCSDLYSDNVRKYDTREFRKNIGKGNVHFINFFAPWCGYCKRLKPVWDELAEKYNTDAMSPKVIVAKVDCTVETPLCAEQGVSGYPSLIFYNGNSEDGIKYKGKRELAALEEFITQNVEGISEEKVVPSTTAPKPVSDEPVLELNDDNFHNAIDSGFHFVKFYAPWCGHCQTLAPVWDELAQTLDYDTSLRISKIDCTVNRQSCSEFEVKAFPTLLWIHDGKKVEKFQGDRTLAELKRFVDNMKTMHNLPKREGEKVPEKAADPTQLVVQLTADNFDNTIAQGVTFVKFFAPWCGHCRRLAPTWEDLAHKFITNAHVRIAKVDCTVETELCNEFKVQGYPTLLIFRNGERLSEYNGLRDLEALHKFVLENLPHDEL